MTQRGIDHIAESGKKVSISCAHDREEPEDVVGIINNSVDNALALLDSIYSSGRMMYYSDYCALHDAIAGAVSGR